MKYLFILVVFYSVAGWTIPEMTRHGYTSCTSCHVSPSGGGVLTDYGRALSRAVFSTWSVKNEEKVLYGITDIPKWLKLGGDYRGIQIHRENSSIKQAKYIHMQADAEAAVEIGKWTGAITYGLQQSQSSSPQKDTPFSRRHYVIYRPIPEVSIRGGKFMQNYGINIPEHTSLIKRGLNWDQGRETYNLEASWAKEKFNLFVTAIFGRPEKEVLQREKGYSINTAYFIDRSRIGFSFFNGKNDTQTRSVVGPYAIIGFSDKFFWMTELDFQFKKPQTISQQKGIFYYNKLGYEVYRGIIPIFIYEMSQSDLKNSNTISRSYGAGLQLFPRPHFEFQLTYQKQLMQAVSTEYSDYAFLMLHYYL